MLVRKSYRYRLYPNLSQVQSLARNFGCARFVYNHMLFERKKYYAEHKNETAKRGLSYEDTTKMLTELKRTPEYAWLKEVNAQVLQQSLKDLDQAYQNFLAARSRYPRFHLKHSKQSIRFPQGTTIGRDWVQLPKIGQVKAVIHRPCEGKIKNMSVSKTKSGRYFVSVQVETEISEPPLQRPGSVGVDLGLKSFLVTSDGISLPVPQNLKKAEKRLVRFQRRLSRRKRNSASWEKARLRIARQHEKIANQRADFLHKTSRWLVDSFGVIGIENLNIRGMVRNHHLSKSISNAGWGEFKRQLLYKGLWAGSSVVIMDRFYPSSKTCSMCGFELDDLNLATRIWTCPSCGIEHQRDLNAARNILFKAQARAGIAQSYADGECVIPVSDWSRSMKSETTRRSG